MTREEAIIVLKYGMKYRNPQNDTEKDRNEALDMAISALSENKGDWIPVTEGLPEIGQRVIATIETLDGLQVRETIYDKYGFLCGHGIAWMPLPEPYKAESEDV